MYRRIALLLFAVMAMAVFVACGDDDDDGGSDATATAASSDSTASAAPNEDVQEITIGGICNLSGQLVGFGEACRDGLQLAVDQIEEDGGFEVDGQRYIFKLEVEDGRSDPTAAVAAANSLVNDKGVKFLFGPDTSPTALQVAGAVKDSGVIEFSGGAVTQQILGTPDYPHLFGVVIPNPQWIDDTVVALQKLGYETGKIAVVYPDDATGSGVAPQVEAILDDAGYDASVTLFPPDTTDFRSVVTRIASDSPDVIVGGYVDAYVTPLTRAIVELDAADAIIGVSVGVQVPLEEATGSPISIPWATIDSVPNLANPTTPGMEALRDLFVEKTGKDPAVGQNKNIVWFYDYVPMLVKAMQQANSVDDIDAITAELEGLTYDGALKGLHFDDMHRPIHGTDVGTVIDGEATWEFIPPVD